MDKCYVYWIRRNVHTDVSKEGYVGISIQPTYRFIEHKNTKNLHLSRAFAKYEDIELEIIEEGSLEFCKEKEKELRPTEYIGWNIASGGGYPPKVMRLENKEEIKKKISDTLKKAGANPYSEKTHSIESKKKSKETRERNKAKMYHDPITGEFRNIKFGLGEIPPAGWVLGRNKRPPKSTKTLGVDFGHVKSWKVISPEGVEYTVRGLKTWCREMNLNYHTVYGNSSGWKTSKI